jgi:hypothetical protein
MSFRKEISMVLLENDVVCVLAQYYGRNKFYDTGPRLCLAGLSLSADQATYPSIGN